MAQLFITECNYDPPLTEEQVADIEERVGHCIEAHGVQWIRSYLARDRRKRICLFEAADAELVRQSFRTAGVQLDRVWAADEITDDDSEESEEAEGTSL
jgi:hypothetical protein